MSNVRKALWQTSEGKLVEVDQRTLVHKVLTHYPVFRELLQNCDDAQSSTIEIHFESAMSREADNGPLVPLNVVQWTSKNDGKLFTPEDWIQLTKIAMGNPDPAKVGAFDVGFYSLFPVTDHPLVSSGVFLDGVCIGCIEETPKLAEIIGLPGALNHFSLLETMAVNQLQPHRFTIQANTLIEVQETLSLEVPSFSGQCDLSPESQLLLPQLDTASLRLRTGDPTCLDTVELDLTVFCVEVDVKVTGKLSRELLRCTTKKPPSQLEYSLVYTGKDDYDRGLAQECQPLMSIFQGLRADLNKALQPRIFIGHPTSQTTGIGGHMVSHFIPTVERESIDLVDKNVAVWNRELLYVGGLLSHTVYELELSAIEASWEESAESRNALLGWFIHILKFFTFHHSTPLAEHCTATTGCIL
ncbi:hypothetical protein HD554DRAFT_2168659 [Boletus coccyginus]|nr:hypothetical protein HD554DRAFT_2168659 [Boletus coccyginus]